MKKISPTFGGSKSLSGNNSGMGKNSHNLFAEIHKQWGLLPGNQGLNNLEQSTQTLGSLATPLENVRKEAEIIAFDVVLNFSDFEKNQRAPDRFCKTMRKTVKEVSDRHDIALKSMVNRLNVGENNTFQTFVNVADEIFEDGQINWGRVIVVYAFAARLVAHFSMKEPEVDIKSSPGIKEKISLYVGKYVGSKLGRWILDNGGSVS